MALQNKISYGLPLNARFDLGRLTMQVHQYRQ